MGDHAQYDRQYRNLSSTQVTKIAGSHPSWGSPTVMEPFAETPQELIRITHYKIDIPLPEGAMVVTPATPLRPGMKWGVVWAKKWNDATIYPIDANRRQKREAWTFFDATQSDGESTLLGLP